MGKITWAFNRVNWTLYRDDSGLWMAFSSTSESHKTENKKNMEAWLTDRAAEKILAAYEAGCRRFDGALTGMGGCPFAGDELVGNIPTEAALTTLASRGVSTGIDTKSLAVACAMTALLRERYTRAVDSAEPAPTGKPN